MRRGILVNAGCLEYQKAWDLQRQVNRARLVGEIADTLILTEHPHTFTLGKTGEENNLVTEESALQQRGIKVYRIDRGGDITYHGPGQIIGYPILDLKQYYLDVHRYLRELEEVLIAMLSEYGLSGKRFEGFTGVWVNGAKVSAIGIKVSRWVTMHGFALNVNTDLSYFGNIVPCGIPDKPVTSMQKLLGYEVDCAEVQEIIVEKFQDIFSIELAEQSLGKIEGLVGKADFQNSV
jgi:lipoyl(octanoyl) transferase